MDAVGTPVALICTCIIRYRHHSTSLHPRSLNPQDIPALSSSGASRSSTPSNPCGSLVFIQQNYSAVRGPRGAPQPDKMRGDGGLTSVRARSGDPTERRVPYDRNKHLHLLRAWSRLYSIYSGHSSGKFFTGSTDRDLKLWSCTPQSIPLQVCGTGRPRFSHLDGSLSCFRA